MIFRRTSFLPCTLSGITAAGRRFCSTSRFRPRPAAARNRPPQHYTLTLTPDLKAATFTGVETIDVTLADPPTTSRSTPPRSHSSPSPSPPTASSRPARGLARRSTKSRPPSPSRHTSPPARPPSPSHYTGILNNELRGFYLSKTAKRNYAVTQFESTDARRAFPSLRRARLQGHLRRFPDRRQAATPPSPTAPSSPTRPAPAPASTRSTSPPRRKCPPISWPFWSATSSAPPASPTA